MLGARCARQAGMWLRKKSGAQGPLLAGKVSACLRCDELSVGHEIGCGGVSPECNDVQLGSAAKDGSLLFFKPALSTQVSVRTGVSALPRRSERRSQKNTESHQKTASGGSAPW